MSNGYLCIVAYTEIIIDIYIQYSTVLHKWSLISYLPSREEFVETGDLPEFPVYLISWVLGITIPREFVLFPYVNISNCLFINIVINRWLMI